MDKAKTRRHRKSLSRGSYLRSRKFGLGSLMTLMLSFGALQFGSFFVVMHRRGLDSEMEQVYLMRQFLNEDNTRGARELTNREHQHDSRHPDPFETPLKTHNDTRKKVERQMATQDGKDDKQKVLLGSNALSPKSGQHQRKSRSSLSLPSSHQETHQSNLDLSLREQRTSKATNSSMDKCQTPREPIWEFENNTFHHDTKASKRLLIGLYSGFGVYRMLLEKTAFINRVYARHWTHDVVLVQGAVHRFKEVDGDCEPPPHRATFNKISLLQYALEHKDKYDQLLIVDTDALVYKMDFDVTTLLPKGRMLAAGKVRKSDAHETWDVNVGVTLWDLHHPRIQSLTKKWLEYATEGVIYNKHPKNDQFHLQHALREGRFDRQIYALDKEFRYGHGTIVKHFIRRAQHKQWGEAGILDNREDKVEIAVEKICMRHKQMCESVEKKSYAE